MSSTKLLKASAESDSSFWPRSLEALRQSKSNELNGCAVSIPAAGGPAPLGVESCLRHCIEPLGESSSQTFHLRPSRSSLAEPSTISVGPSHNFWPATLAPGQRRRGPCYPRNPFSASLELPRTRCSLQLSWTNTMARATTCEVARNERLPTS